MKLDSTNKRTMTMWAVFSIIGFIVFFGGLFLGFQTPTPWIPIAMGGLVVLFITNLLLILNAKTLFAAEEE